MFVGIQKRESLVFLGGLSTLHLAKIKYTLLLIANHFVFFQNLRLMKCPKPTGIGLLDSDFCPHPTQKEK